MVTLSIATSDKTLRPTEKAVLYHLLCDEYMKDSFSETDERTCVVVDSMATVQALGKPANTSTFGDFQPLERLSDTIGRRI